MENVFSAPANVVSSILNDDRKGRKNGRGFYLYGQKGRKSKKTGASAIYPLIGAQRAGATLSAGCLNGV